MHSLTWPIGNCDQFVFYHAQPESILPAIVVGTVYYLPSFVAVGRQRINAWGIYLVNGLLGWTGVGWLIALAWSLISIDLFNRSPRTNTLPSVAGRFLINSSLLMIAALTVEFAIGPIQFFEYLDESKIGRTFVDVRTIMNACKTYRIKFGEWPPTLSALVNDPNGKPYLEGGQEAIIDPWGREYYYSRAGIHSGGEAPDIWSLGPDPSNADCVIGNWTQYPRRTVLLGMTETEFEYLCLFAFEVYRIATALIAKRLSRIKRASLINSRAAPLDK